MTCLENGPYKCKPRCDLGSRGVRGPDGGDYEQAVPDIAEWRMSLRVLQQSKPLSKITVATVASLTACK
jgi:hypothetical protein